MALYYTYDRVTVNGQYELKITVEKDDNLTLDLASSTIRASSIGTVVFTDITAPKQAQSPAELLDNAKRALRAKYGGDVDTIQRKSEALQALLTKRLSTGVDLIEYYYNISGSEITITVLRDHKQEYQARSSTESKEVLLAQAKLELKNRYPDRDVQTNVNEIPAPPTPPPPPTPKPKPKPKPLPTQTRPAVRKKLSTNKPKGKGIEGIITSISKQIANIDSKVDDIYYGNKTKNTGIKLPGSTSKENGLLPLVQEIAKIDLCNVLTFLTSNTKIPKDSIVGKKLKVLDQKTKTLSDKLANTKVGSAAVKNTQNLKDLSLAIADTSILIDNDVIAAVPQLANAKNYLDDVNGTITSYSNLNTVPDADVQRILSKIKGVESTVSSIKSISSAQDALNIIQNAANVNIANQLQDLQKIINPAQLIPTLKRVSNTLKGINQIALKIVNYLRILQVITKVSTVLLKVMDVIRKILSFIPIPNMVTIVTITQKFSEALQTIKKTIETGLKRVAQIGKLVELIYNFAIGLIAKIGDLVTVVDTILFNLQTCDATADSPILADLLDTKATLQDTTNKLSKFTATYETAQKTGDTRLYNGLTLKIVQEEVVDNGVKNLRRKAVALDTRGVVVAETELTFATDTDTLFQELQLILQNKGIVNDTSNITSGVDQLGIDLTGAFPTDQETYQSVGLSGEEELISTSAEATAEVSNFIDGIKKGGKKFKQRVRQITAKFATDSAKSLKDTAKSGNFKGANPSSSKFAGSLNKAASVSTGTPASEVPVQKLSLAERDKWTKISRNENKEGRIIAGLYPDALRKKAIEILAKDDEAYS